MILQKGFKTGDVVSIKLSSGEEVVGRYDLRSSNSFLMLEKPVVLSMSPNGIALIPYMFTAADGSIPFNEGLIVAKVATADDIVKQYLQSTTGIALG